MKVPIPLKYIEPKSVIDIDCGIGTWLNILARYVGDNYLGLDGEYVKKELLMIP